MRTCVGLIVVTISSGCGRAETTKDVGADARAAPSTVAATATASSAPPATNERASVRSAEPKKLPAAECATAGESRVILQIADGTPPFVTRCRHVCVADKDCPAATICTGEAIALDGVSRVSFCVKDSRPAKP